MQRRFGLLVLLLLVIASFVISGCGGGGRSGGGSSRPQLGARIVSDDRVARAFGSVAWAAELVDPSKTEGLYFGELEVVAYDYRPGEAVQEHFGTHGYTGRDWSYHLVLAGGSDASRHHILRKGDEINLLSINQDPLYKDEISQEFVEATQSTGGFMIDFLEVQLIAAGVVYNSRYYGLDTMTSTGAHPLYRDPTWEGIPIQRCHTKYGDMETDVLSVFFARSDWFPQALRVLVEPVFDADDRISNYRIVSSSIGLNAEQEQILLSLLDQGTRRHVYNHIVIVPFGPAQSVTGNTMFDIRIDMDDVLDANLSDMDPANPNLVFTLRNNVPFNLTSSITTF